MPLGLLALGSWLAGEHVVIVDGRFELAPGGPRRRAGARGALPRGDRAHRRPPARGAAGERGGTVGQPGAPDRLGRRSRRRSTRRRAWPRASSTRACLGAGEEAMAAAVEDLARRAPAAVGGPGSSWQTGTLAEEAPPPGDALAARRLLAARRRAALRAPRRAPPRLLLEPGGEGRLGLDGDPGRARGGRGAGARRAVPPVGGALPGRGLLRRPRRGWTRSPAASSREEGRSAGRPGRARRTSWRPRPSASGSSRRAAAAGSTWTSQAGRCPARAPAGGRGSRLHAAGSRRASSSTWRSPTVELDGLAAAVARGAVALRARRALRDADPSGLGRGAMPGPHAGAVARGLGGRTRRRRGRTRGPSGASPAPTFFLPEAQRDPGRRLGQAPRAPARARARAARLLRARRRSPRGRGLGAPAHRAARGARASRRLRPRLGPSSCAARAASRTAAGRRRGTCGGAGRVRAAGKPARGDAEVDLEGRFLLPALVNAHDVLDLSTLPPLGTPPFALAVRVDAGRRGGPRAPRARARGAARRSALPRRPAQPPRGGGRRPAPPPRPPLALAARTSRCAFRGATASPTRPGSPPPCAGRTAPATAASPGWCGRSRARTRGCARSSTCSPRRTCSGRTP